MLWLNDDLIAVPDFSASGKSLAYHSVFIEEQRNDYAHGNK
jgi:hypothetical protein